jgi:hypothetical protein
MNIAKLSQLTIGLTLFTAISKFEIYTWPFRTIGQDGFFHPLTLGTNLSAILFILSPLLAVYFYRKNSNACYFWLGIFAIPAFLFGMTPIPFATYLYSSNVQLNTVFIAIIDVLFVILVWFIYRANKQIMTGTRKPHAPHI